MTDEEGTLVAQGFKRWTRPCSKDGIQRDHCPGGSPAPLARVCFPPTSALKSTP